MLDSARSLTNAEYAVITIVGDSGVLEDVLFSGVTQEESQQLREMPDGLKLFEYLSRIPGPLREPDFADFAMSAGFPDCRLPVPGSSFLTAPIRHRSVGVGRVYVGKREPGQEFGRDDEETLEMFASQVALVVANARRHQDERRARAGLETLINTSPVGVLVFDVRTGAPVSINQETRRIVEPLRKPDQSPEQLLEVLTFRREDGREVSLQEFSLSQLLNIGETLRAEEIVMKVPDGKSVTTLINSTPIRSEEGEIESVVVTMQDMTPFEEMERLRAEFLGMVSHELRTPLTSIRGSATGLLDAPSDLDSAETRQFLRIIVDQADNMRDLIRDLLDVARLETGTLPVSPEAVEVAVLVDRARNTFLSGGGRSILRIDLAPDLPLVMADRRRIVQVIGNLLSNASRNSPESSSIRMAAVRDGVHVAISVADEGRGIPADRLPHLFRKFYRTEAEDHGGDTGLGLAICKGIVEAHGGRIWAESEGMGLGARFTFTVPAVEEAPATSPLGSTRSPQAASEGESILVVDDDPQTLRYVRNVLSDMGYDPTVTAEPEEVLQLVEEHRPHLVLLDLMLPGSDGIELMEAISDLIDVPVIFISAYGRDHVIARAFEAGAADYIVKPFSPTELVARIRAALRRRDAPFSAEPSKPYVLDDLTINYAERLVTVAGRPVRLTPIEYALLVQLSIHAGRVVTHHRLLNRVWGPGKSRDTRTLRTLRTHLRRLRRKLGDDARTPNYIFAQPRVGYRMPHGELPRAEPNAGR